MLSALNHTTFNTGPREAVIEEKAEASPGQSPPLGRACTVLYHSAFNTLYWNGAAELSWLPSMLG